MITVATASVTPTTGAVIAALNSTADKSSITLHSSSFGASVGRPKTNLRLPNCVGLSVLTKQAIPSSQFGSTPFVLLSSLPLLLPTITSPLLPTEPVPSHPTTTITHSKLCPTSSTFRMSLNMDAYAFVLLVKLREAINSVAIAEIVSNDLSGFLLNLY